MIPRERAGASGMLRRCLVFAALLVWHGGVTLYAAVVIPVGLSTLDPPSQQTFVTQRVTHYLNLGAVPILGLLAWDVKVTRDPRVGRRRGRWLTWAGTTVALLILFRLHSQLDVLMDRDTLSILDREAVRPLHRLYLGVSGFQWTCVTVFAFLTLWAWRAEDLESQLVVRN